MPQHDGIEHVTNVDGLILAGGESNRMGPGNKALATLAGKTLLEHVIDRLNPQVASILLNGVRSSFDNFPYPVVEDKLDNFQGPLTGLYSAFESGKLTSADYVMMVACDGPFFPENLVSKLYCEINKDESDVACVRYQGVAQPMFSLWHKRTAAIVRKTLLIDKNGGFKPLIGSLRSVYLDWPELSVNPFLNVNTPEDLKFAETLV